MPSFYTKLQLKGKTEALASDRYQISGTKTIGKGKKMGMAASQARLLSITARLTNNENTGQAVSYSKQRLADQTQQITNEYNEALDATKLTVLVGFNGAQANYEDISYKLMTGMQMASTTKQYVVTDTKGKVLVTNEIAEAYEKSHGNYNVFLEALGYSQADISVQITSTDEKAKAGTQQQIHEAWDKYFESVGINKFMPEHDLGICWTETYSKDADGDYLMYKMIGGEKKVVKLPKDKDTNNDGKLDSWDEATIKNNAIGIIGDGYAGFKRVKTDKDGKIVYNQIAQTDIDGNVVKDKDGNPVMIDDLDHPVYETDKNGNYIWDPINYEGTTEESRNLYDYAMAITEAYLRVGKGENGVPFKTEYDMDALKSLADPDNASAIKYYQNIFNKIQSSGYFTYTNTPSKVSEDPDHYVYTSEGTGTKGNVKKNPLQDNYTFEAALRDGSLRLEYYSSTDKAFKSTTISEDNCIQEVADERAIARAETKYTQDMADLENKDKKLDLELKKLDTEHSALQTEYDAVKNVVDKNVESSFKIFS